MDESEAQLEFFVEPFAEGRPGAHVKAAIEAVASRGLEVQIGPFGSVAHGELEDLVDAAGPLLRSALSSGADRISVHITTRSDSRPAVAPGATNLHDALSRMIAAVERDLGAPLPQLSREDKQAAVRLLDAGGAFLLRKAVDDVAVAMGVSRITIYNYLNADKEG